MNSAPFLVAITGGSAAGKSWLANQLQTLLGGNAARLSLDDFYRDRAHLTPAQRARVNYDHPRAIDWPCVEHAMRECLAGNAPKIPCYDFATHSRKSEFQLLEPKPVVLMEGLWLLRRPSLRRMFGLTIFIDCPAPLRLKRRIARDIALRGRTSASVRRQFKDAVEPMHALHVLPQARWADIRLQAPIQKTDLLRVAAELNRRARIAVI